MIKRVEFRGDLEALIRSLPETDHIRKYIEHGGAFYLSDDQEVAAQSGKIEVCFYLFEDIHYFYVERSEVEIHD